MAFHTYLLLLIRTSVCIDVFTGCMPPKTAWDRAQRRSECELNFIHQSRVLKQWKRTKRSIQAPGYTTVHFTPFKMDAKKWRENRENLVSYSESRWSVLVSRSGTQIAAECEGRSCRFETHLQSNQVKRTSQDCINELIIWNLNPLVVSRMQ